MSFSNQDKEVHPEKRPIIIIGRLTWADSFLTCIPSRLVSSSRALLLALVSNRCFPGNGNKRVSDRPKAKRPMITN